MIHRPHTVPGKRRGLTLLEVVFALVIFMLSFVALSELVRIATNNAHHVQQQGQALLLCQAKLAEVGAGVRGLENIENYSPLSQDSDWGSSLEGDWQWKMTAAEDPTIPGLYTVQVWVMRETEARKVEVTLSQLVFDPHMRGSTADIPGVTTTSPDSSATPNTTPDTSSTPSDSTTEGK